MKAPVTLHPALVGMIIGQDAANCLTYKVIMTFKGSKLHLYDGKGAKTS
jgi:hypothetical protein